MSETKSMEVRCVQYELSITIEAPRARVWRRSSSNVPIMLWYLLGAIVTLYLGFVLLSIRGRGLAVVLTAVLVVLPALMPRWTLFKQLTPPNLVSLESSENAYPAVMELSERIKKSQIAFQDIRGELDELRELLDRSRFQFTFLLGIGGWTS